MSHRKQEIPKFMTLGSTTVWKIHTTESHAPYYTIYVLPTYYFPLRNKKAPYSALKSDKSAIWEAQLFLYA